MYDSMTELCIRSNQCSASIWVIAGDLVSHNRAMPQLTLFLLTHPDLPSQHSNSSLVLLAAFAPLAC